jgi:V8-like Glu-specific endopeptidase
MRLYAIVVSALVAPAICAQAPAVEDGTNVYQRVLKSTAWIHSPRGPGKVASGTGSLIDLKNRLVLTNYHVVGDVDPANVFFPSYNHDGRLVAEKTYYTDNSIRLRWPGKVVARDPIRDLALIQLEKLPPNVVALPLAAKGVSPGQTVHSIGNPGPSGALWVYTPGKVRQVYFKRWRAMLDDREATFEAEVIESDSPTNPGDSGGPLVNDRGELVGVTQGGAIKANSLSTFIDISEVRKFLSEPRVKNKGFRLRNRPVALLSVDGGRFFSEDALKFINDTAKETFTKSSRDLVVETYAAIPGGKSAEVKAMSPSEREKFFRDWTKSRMESEDMDGVLLVVTRDPSHLHFEVSPSLRLSAEDVKKLREGLLAAFREKKFDDGVREFVKEAAVMIAR